MPEFTCCPPLSLYIHLPWCVKKCPYCDFNSHGTGGAAFPEKAYIDALIRDLDLELPGIRDRQISSIFIGGGTPSLFSADSLHLLLSSLRARMKFVPDIEITLEANPGTVESARFRSYRDAGINRLSIGIQSFNDAMLNRLGRIHDGADAANAIRTAQAAGYDLINLDLMYGLPDQTLVQAMEDIHQALEHKSAHLSWYQLTIEPNTLFYKDRPALPEEDAIWEIQQQGQSLLAAAAYHQYEISAYATSGNACRHNLNYWQFGDYLGLGAGAHGKLTVPAQGQIYRFVRHRLPERYIRLAGTDKAISSRKNLDNEDIILEFMMNNLRLTGGFDSVLFSERTGLSVDLIADRLSDAVIKGWLQRDDDRIRPTVTGLNYLNDLLQCFMPGSRTGNPVNSGSISCV